MDNLTLIHDQLSFIWWIALGLSFLLYVILDGADLGAGIFSLFVKDEDERGAIMASMAGTWDANETWLVVAGGILFGGFPIVYGSAFHYLLVPLMVALWSIMMRAVSLEFRAHSDRSRRFWDWAFGIGSLTATFCAGMALGAILTGFPVTDVVELVNESAGQVPTFTGGTFDFFSPFSIWTGVAAIIAASLAGGIYLKARFELDCEIRGRASVWTSVTFYLALVAVVVTLVWSYFELDWAADKWTGPYGWIWWTLGVAVLLAAFKMRLASIRNHDLAAMLWLAIVIALMWGGMMATMYPWLVPGTWTIHSGGSPATTLESFTIAMSGFIPVMLMYNWYQIWVFRARITTLDAYARH